MNLYDTAKRAIRPLEISHKPISLYVCGITPYDAAHLGHAFTYHVFDVLTRRLIDLGHKVLSVRNITDVDDDILRVARERKIPYQDLVQQEVLRFNAAMSALNILPVNYAPLASQHIVEIVTWIQRLETVDITYTNNGWVYFDISKFPNYGKLSQLPFDQMLAISRERGGNPDDPRKKSPLDFVLWQPSASDEPSWSSPWGEGRPGWHIECTAMATHYLGEIIDIHGGGADLIFPHHESELAQSESVTKQQFVKHWMHVALVELNGIKMSKSLGNLIFVNDLLTTTNSGVVRLILANHHYRRAWDFSPTELQIAHARYDRYNQVCRTKRWLDSSQIEAFTQRFYMQIDNDLNTSEALLILDEICDALSTNTTALNNQNTVDGALVLRHFLGILGVVLSTDLGSH